MGAQRSSKSVRVALRNAENESGLIATLERRSDLSTLETGASRWEENMNQDNSVLALYAAFAGFILILLVVYKIWTAFLSKKRARGTGASRREE